MSKRLAVTGLVALALLLLFSQTAQAGVVQGSILNVDVLNNRIHVIQPDGKIFVFARVPNTVVTLNGKPYRFDLLQVGWQVTVQFRDSTGVAVRIDAVNL